MVAKSFSQTPVIDFTFTSGIINPGDTVTFTNTSSGFPTGTLFIWNFGEVCYAPANPDSFNLSLCNDTTVNVSQLIIHRFSQSKPFYVTMYAFDGSGTEHRISKWVIIQGATTCSSPACGNFICNSMFDQIDLGYYSDYWRLGQYIDNTTGSLHINGSSYWYGPLPDPSPDLFMNIVCLVNGSTVTHTDVTNMLLPYFCNQPDHSVGAANPGYAAIATRKSSADCNGTAREYIQQRFTPLTAGKKYDVHFFTSLADWSLKSTDIGALISVNPPSPMPGLDCDILIGAPQISATLQFGPFIHVTDKVGWTRIFGSFTATGGEQYITIGNFEADNMMQYVGIGNADPSCPNPGVLFSDKPYYLVDDVTIEKHLDLTASIVPACDGINNGSITITNIDGTFGPYSFIWSNGANTQSLTGLAGGTYTVTVTDNVGCPKEFTYVVASGTSPAIPKVDGDHYGCTIQNCFMVLNPVAGCSYTWQSTSASMPTGSSIWACPPFDPTVVNNITFTATDPAGCSSTSDPFIVAPCCTGTYTFTDLSVNQAYVMYPTAFAVAGALGIGLPATQTLAINGTFTIDHDFTLDHTEVILGPDAQINILPGFNVYFTGGSHLHTCNQDYMWNEITVNDNSVLNITHTTLEEAQIAVHCLTGGTVNTSTQTIFNANFKSIQFDLSNVNHIGEIEKTTFECNDLISGNPITLIPPYTGQNPDCGIEINDGASIKIGNENNTTYNPPSHQNLFRNLNLGVKLRNSNAEIVNNRFENIRRYQDDPFHLKGFCIQGSSPNGTTSVVSIGGGNVPSLKIYKSNEFENSLNGIRLNNQVTCDIFNNKFNLIQANGVTSGVAGTCINLYNHNAANLNVRNNFLDNFDYGITMSLLTDIDINVENNYLNSSSRYANYEATIGIRISRTPMVNLFTSPKEVHGNVIKHSIKGIFSQSAQGLNIHDNTIEFDPADITNNPVYRYGIHLISGGASGYGIHNIESNWIYKTGSVFNLADEKLAAINIQSSGKNDVVNNLINKMGVGVYFGTTTIFNTVHCNEMNDCLTGVRFDNADIGNQGTPGPNGISQGNKWNYSCFGCYALKKVLSTTTPTWYVESSAPVNTLPSYPNGLIHMSPPSFVTMDNGNNDILPAVDCNVPCPTCPPPRMADIVTGSGEFANMSPDERYRALNEVFRILNADTFYMYMGLPSDIILQNFYDSAYYTNIGMLTTVDELIADSINFVADILNSWVSPENHFEENAVAVNEIYLAACASGDCIFDSVQYATLYAIASENPYSGGDAVYTAREMLDLMFDDYLSEPAAKFSNQSAVSLPTEIKVYPNPSKNYFAIDLTNLEENGKWDYTITDYLGSIVTQREGINLSNTIVNTVGFQQGVYLLQVTINNKNHNLKVVVIK